MADRTPGQEVRERRDKNLPLWRPYWTAMDEERRMLDGDIYVNNTNWHNRDRRQVQIRGRETCDTVRHYVSRATEKPRNAQARPIDQEGDADQAEVEVALVEQELANPLKCFEECLELTLKDSREIGMGITWMDWCPEEGPWGEIIYSAEDPSRYMWDWAYADLPHHQLCGWLQRVHRMPVDYARERYNAPWLEPDRFNVTQMRSRTGLPLQNLRDEFNAGQAPDDDRVTLIEEWRKNDRSIKGYKDTGERALEPDDRYMACADGCGYRSETQGALKQQDKLVETLPEMMEGCPDCGGMLERVDTLGEQKPALIYPKGRRLIIAAAFQSGPKGEDVFDGKWPVPSARSFPMLYVCMDPKRGRPRGESDPSWHWDQQIAADHLRTQALQRTLEHRTYKRIPADGIKNAKGKRFEFRDDDFDVMYADNSAMGPLEVQFYNASGLDPAWNTAFQPIYQSLTQYSGKYDQGPIEDRSAKSGVALQTENAIGEIPVARFNRIKNRALSQFYGVVSDYIHATYSMQRVARLNIDGSDMVVQLWGQDMANYDFIIEDNPDFTGIEKARSEAWDAAMNLVMQGATPELIESWGAFHQVPRSVVRGIIKAMNAMLEMQQKQQAQELERMAMEAESAGKQQKQKTDDSMALNEQKAAQQMEREAMKLGLA